MLREKALREIGEDESRKRQSLEIFKEWIRKHPFIKFNVNDDSYLLLYLRGRKYVMNEVFRSFENKSIFIKKNPQWSKIERDEIPKCVDICRQTMGITRFCDAEGRKIFVFRVAKFDHLSLTVDEFCKYAQIFHTGFDSMDEAVQLHGVVFVYDFRGINPSFFSRISISSLIEYCTQFRFAVVRMKQMNVIGMPSAANFVFGVVRRAFSEKIQSRMNLLNNLSDLAKYMDTSELLNGDKSDFKEGIFLDPEPILRRGVSVFEMTEVDFSKTSEFEPTGSFRKLEID